MSGQSKPAGRATPVDNPGHNTTSQALQGRPRGDVTIAFDNGQRVCNREVLSQASDYFRALFSGRFLEANSPIVELHDVDPVALKETLNFIHSRSLLLDREFDLWFNVSIMPYLSKLQAVLVVADKHGVRCCQKRVVKLLSDVLGQGGHHIADKCFKEAARLLTQLDV
ncbi:BTB/POZ domain-containing protein 7 [Elsinoe australis]|uniref:BTB/POZ domain-containing protein 7 n=1 Tax=Elsinoe australis TaxID=40998 RepID=A0A4U7B642_9PEZI|nr:BTB/POZ domain-containing protein 7 [Elsinoe australis]